MDLEITGWTVPSLEQDFNVRPFLAQQYSNF